MKDSDKLEFYQILKEAFEIHEKEISNSKLNIYFNLFKKYPMAVFSSALLTHIERSKFSPKPADLKDIIDNMDGRPDSNEAWSISQASKNEDETIVWTNEMQEAFGVATPILMMGDIQGAKMAFREVYEKLVRKSRDNQIPIKWNVSIGHDKTRVNDAINQARYDGRISHDDSTRYLTDSATVDGMAIAGLLTGTVVNASDDMKAKLALVKLALKNSNSPLESSREKRRMEHEARVEFIENKKLEFDELLKELT